VFSESISPVEYLQAFVVSILSQSLFVLCYIDKSFEFAIAKHQKAVCLLSKSEANKFRVEGRVQRDSKNDTDTGLPKFLNTKETSSFAAQDGQAKLETLRGLSCSHPKAESVRRLMASPGVTSETVFRKMLDTDSKKRLASVDEVLELLRKYYKSHFSGESSYSILQTAMSWICPFIAMLGHILIPRIWMEWHYKSGFMPTHRMSVQHISDEDYSDWVWWMMVHNSFVTVCVGTLFLHQLWDCIMDFHRVHEQALILDGVTTYGYDYLSLDGKAMLRHITYRNLQENWPEGVKVSQLTEDDVDVIIGWPVPEEKGKVRLTNSRMGFSHPH